MNINKYIFAGLKSKKIKEKIKDYILSQKFIDINTLYFVILDYIKLHGCKPFFPPNINAPGVVAHDTAGLNENRKIYEGVIKIDIGIQYKKIIIDTAFSISFNTDKYNKYHLINENFFDKILPNILKPGLNLKVLAKSIQTYYTDNGLKIIPQLLGHTIKYPILHCTPYFANTQAYASTEVLKEGQMFTIEPHTAVKDEQVILGPSKIYSYNNKFYSPKSKISLTNSKLNVEFYPTILLKNTENNDSFIYEHTYIVYKNEVIRLS